MKKLGIILILFFGTVGWMAVAAQQPLDLKTALQYALAHHAEVQNASMEIGKGQQLVREAISTGLPQAGLNWQMVNNLKLRSTPVPAELFGGPPGTFQNLKFGTNWNASAGLSLEQMAFSKTWLMGLKATYAVTDFYKLVLDKTKEDVVYEVAKLYYQIQLSRTQRGLLEANLRQIEGLLKATEQQYQNGFAKKIDVDRLSVQQFNLETELTNLDLMILQSEQALKFSMQMPLEAEIVLTDTISEASFKAVNLSMAQPGYQQKTDLKILKKQQELYGLDEQRWKAGYFPSASLFATYNYEWQANNLGDFGKGRFWSDFAQIGLRINVPIFDGFYKDSKIQTARLNARQIAQSYNFALLGLQLKHETALTTLRANQNKLKALEENRRIAGEVYRVSESRYKEGLAPITELLDAESSLRQAQSNYVSILAQLKLAEIDLLHTNGALIKLAE
ncbi:MAG: TolC family protein [Saprospiraceae bacterium]|nr:MAG: TolC family protein [Saprospiraceae bacterium]